MKMDDFVAVETARGWSYKLLADCYQRPDDETVEKINGLTSILKTVCPNCASYIDSITTGKNRNFELDPIKVDYARLFVGPFEIPAAPYGSVYLEDKRRLMGDSTLDVIDRYRGAGLKIASCFSEPPDHIAVEFEFMSYLIFKAIEASSNSDAAEMANIFGVQKCFLEDHLGAWVLEFTDAVEKNAATDFYRNLARATAGFIKSDWQAISTPVYSEYIENAAEIESVSGS